MAFETVKYQTDAGTIVRIRVSSATIAAVGNTAITAAVDDGNIFAFAQNPGSKRKKQLNARGLRLERFTGTGAARKRFTTFMPVFSPTAFGSYVIQAELTVDSVLYNIADKINEA